jgi:hypothetical protein
MNLRLNKKDTFALWAVVLLSAIIGIFGKYEIPLSIYSDLITFLSILVGFQVAAFAMLFSSPTVKALYEIKDAENKYITLKHRLKNYYEFAFSLSLISILLIFMLEIFNLNILWINRAVILSIITSNIFIHYRTMRFLYKVFIKDR